MIIRFIIVSAVLLTAVFFSAAQADDLTLYDLSKQGSRFSGRMLCTLGRPADYKEPLALFAETLHNNDLIGMEVAQLIKVLPPYPEVEPSDYRGGIKAINVELDDGTAYEEPLFAVFSCVDNKVVGWRFAKTNKLSNLVTTNVAIKYDTWNTQKRVGKPEFPKIETKKP